MSRERTGAGYAPSTALVKPNGDRRRARETAGWLASIVVDYFANPDHDSAIVAAADWRMGIMTDGLYGVRAGRFPAPGAVVEAER